jgi:hypothetical protein
VRVEISRTRTLRLAAAGAVALGLGMLAACAPEPAPTPTPTAAFASEEEAFAAAEEVYREFTDRMNRVDISDPRTFEPLYELTSGTFEANDRESYSAMHAEGYVMTGKTRLLTFQGVSTEPPFEVVVANVCLDVSDVSVVNSDGVSQVSPDRGDISAVEITFQRDGADLLINAAKRNDPATCESS